jgi:putative sterol carrier protein
MSIVFPSAEWIDAFKAQVDASEGYRASGRTWVHGPVALVVEPEADKGVPEPMAVWLDLHEGVCRDAHEVSVEEAQAAPYVITGSYTRWKQVSQRQLDPVKGMMQGKLRLKGDLPTIVRHVRAARDLVECSTRIPGLVFADER